MAIRTLKIFMTVANKVEGDNVVDFYEIRTSRSTDLRLNL